MGESVSSIRTDRINVNSNGINDSVKNSNEAANNSEVKKLESEEISIDIDVDDSNEDVYELMALDESESENMKNRVSMFEEHINKADTYIKCLEAIQSDMDFKEKVRIKAVTGNWFNKIINLIINGEWNEDAVIYNDFRASMPYVKIEENMVTIQSFDGITYRYQDGYCTSIEFTNGVILDLSYGPNGEIYDVNYNFNIYSEFLVDSQQFGGDQGALATHASQFVNDPIAISLMKKYFPEATELDYTLYFNALNSVGCGYTAFINTVFEHFQGREAEFESTFGFPMFNIDANGNIDYNYEYLILDLFNYVWGNQEYTIQELYGEVDLNSDDEAKAGERREKVVQGMNISSLTGIEEDKITKSAILYTATEWLSSHNIDVEIINCNLRRLEPHTDAWYREIDNLRAKGFTNLDYNYEGDLNAIISFEEKLSMIEEALSNNSGIVLSLDVYNGFTLLNMDGSVFWSNVGPHAMCVVGINDLGLIVSSWGGQYIVPFSDAEKGNIYVYDY